MPRAAILGPAGAPAAAPTTALERLAARQAAAAATPATRPGGSATGTSALAARPGVTAPLRPGMAPATRPGLTTPAPAVRAGLAAPARPGLTTPNPALTPRPSPTASAPAARTASLPSTVRPPGSTGIAGVPRRTPSVPLALPTPLEIENAVDHEGYERFAAGIKTLLGFDLTQYKRPQVWRRANSFAKQKGCRDVHELVERCKTDLDLRTAVRDMITINVSEFFRNPEAWEALRTMAMPELLKLGRPIRFWSAGCSLGYEPYTFAMLVKEAAGGADARIAATDLDETILAQARASAYAEHQMVGVSKARRSRFFEERDGLAVVRPELRGMVTWRRHDLLRDPFPADQDLIACRNVVIYFTDEAKDGLYRHFTQALRMGGILFIGATEAISAPRDFGLQMITSGIYRRVA